MLINFMTINIKIQDFIKPTMLNYLRFQEEIILKKNL